MLSPDAVTIPTEADTFTSAGPLGILLGVAFFFYLACRELRRYRQIDVQTYQADIAQMRAEQTERDKEHRKEVAELKNDIEDLKSEVGALRDQHFQESRAAARRQEELVRENAGLRALLAANNIPTEGIG